MQRILNQKGEKSMKRLAVSAFSIVCVFGMFGCSKYIEFMTDLATDKSVDYAPCKVYETKAENKSLSKAEREKAFIDYANCATEQEKKAKEAKKSK